MAVLVGKKAPDFKAKAIVNGKIVENFSLASFKGKNVVFFFYPLDFTFVCPTELHAFQEKLPEFEKRNTQVVGCSVDSCYSHHAWLNTPKAKGGIEGVSYPIISDINKSIAQAYDVLVSEEGIAYRGLFLIDKEGTIRHQVVNDLPLGRSVDETLRILDALLFFEKNGEVCPANWSQGSKGMKPNQKGLETFFQPAVVATVIAKAAPAAVKPKAAVAPVAKPKAVAAAAPAAVKPKTVAQPKKVLAKNK